MQNNPSVEYVKFILEYNNSTGWFCWNQPYHFISENNEENHSHVGSDGNLVIKIGSEFYLAEEVAFAIVVGRWPSENIVHLDGDIGNNKWSNLHHGKLAETAWDKEVARIKNLEDDQTSNAA